MSEAVEAAIRTLNDKLGGEGMDGSVRLVIEGEGAVRIDETGATADAISGESGADVTLTASSDTFRALLDGDLDPTGAFLSGKLKVEGDMGLAMKLGTLLA